MSLDCIVCSQARKTTSPVSYKKEEMEEEGEIKDHLTLEITQLEPTQMSPITYEIKRKLEEVSFACSIFHVPHQLRNQQENAYQPILVSIGPFHHNKTHLQHMESHKWKYLNSLLSRNLTLLDTTLDSCVQALKELEPKIRGCYRGDIDLSSDKFLTMILLDAGFIIELFVRYYIKGFRIKDDTLLKSPDRLYELRNDLILLENQIPFFVLRRIYRMVLTSKQTEKSISELCLKFFKNLIPREHRVHEKYNFEGSYHIVDLLWKCHLPSFYNAPLNSNTGSREIHSTTKLQQSGIRVKSAEAESIMDVIFIKGKLVIPSLRIHNHMETLFRNMIAWEHCQGENKIKYVTSYAYLMKGLLHHESDVRLFRQKKIFVEHIQDKGKVVAMFKDLCEGVDLDKFYYDRTCEEVKKYKRTILDLCLYKLKRKFWREGSAKWEVTCVLIFAVVLLFMTLFVILFLFFRHEKHES